MERRREFADGAAPDNRRTHSNLMQMENASHHRATQSVGMQVERIMKPLMAMLLAIVNDIQYK